MSVELLPLLLIFPLLALVGCEWVIWQQEGRRQSLQRVAGWLSRLIIGLATVSLIGLSWFRRRVPPVSLDEMLLVFSLLNLGLYQTQRHRLNEPTALLTWLLSGLVLVVGEAGYLLWLGVTDVGSEPLWLTGVLARWLLLSGLAGLYWLAVMAGLGLWQDGTATLAPHLTWLGDVPASDSLSRRLRPFVSLTILSGTLLFLLWQWWGWGAGTANTLHLSGLILLLTATWWLYLIWPQQRPAERVLIVLTFITALPLLSI